MKQINDEFRIIFLRSFEFFLYHLEEWAKMILRFFELQKLSKLLKHLRWPVILIFVFVIVEKEPWKMHDTLLFRLENKLSVNKVEVIKKWAEDSFLSQLNFWFTIILLRGGPGADIAVPELAARIWYFDLCEEHAILEPLHHNRVHIPRLPESELKLSGLISFEGDAVELNFLVGLWIDHHRCAAAALADYHGLDLPICTVHVILKTNIRVYHLTWGISICNYSVVGSRKFE